MGTAPLASSTGATSHGLGLSRETTMGHVHLHVAHLPDAEAFYVGLLGFQVMQRYGSGALFVSAGGYHHHIGLNTWAGVGAHRLRSEPSGCATSSCACQTSASVRRSSTGSGRQASRSTRRTAACWFAIPLETACCSPLTLSRARPRVFPRSPRARQPLVGSRARTGRGRPFPRAPSRSIPWMHRKPTAACIQNRVRR